LILRCFWFQFVGLPCTVYRPSGGGALSGTLRRVSKVIPVSPSLWTIAEVEQKTGLGKDVLRVWERRYGFPVPQRDARGDRVYDQDQLGRLRLIKQLLDAGVRAGGIVPKAEHELRALLAETETAISPSMEPRFEAWLDLLLRGDTAGMRATLQRERKRQGLESWLSDEIFRLGLWVGQAWQSQRIKVYHQHLFCEVLQAELRKVLAAIHRRAIPQDGPRVLLPPCRRSNTVWVWSPSNACLRSTVVIISPWVPTRH